MRLKNPKAKGARAERRTRVVLQAAGYYCLKAGGSLGIFDLVAIGFGDLRCIQVKAGTQYCSGIEREQIQSLPLPVWATKEIWRWPDRAKEPIIEWIR
jgi:Archaeal holliday junction resolvase (hjc).